MGREMVWIFLCICRLFLERTKWIYNYNEARTMLICVSEEKLYYQAFLARSLLILESRPFFWW